MKQKLYLSWSSGKDSAWALHILKRQANYEIAGLVTTFNAAFDRVAMHSTRRKLVEIQALAAGLPLIAVPLPWPCSNAEYETIMTSVCRQAVDRGVKTFAFGDLFLADIRAYRERQLQGTGLEPIFPLWQIPTDKLAEEMIDGGLRAKLVCVDPAKLDSKFVGRDFDRALLSGLPVGVDPCGENGEFHTFAYAGPMFNQAIEIVSGERVQRDGFWFCDLLPGKEAADEPAAARC
ncbi:MAG TPA: ATP-binding protein [Candidatus Angelobacter sp.]|nr:ATP-binding protein [Candidatus Angelobacter sp.]